MPARGSDWAEILPHEVRTAHSLAARGLIELHEAEGVYGPVFSARLADGVVWPPDDPSSAFTKEMALSVRLGAVALGLLMAEQLLDALQAVLGCRATDMDIARINRAAELIEKIVTSRES